MNKNSKELSLIICAYKESPYLEDCIKSLINQKMKCNVAISTSTPNELVKSLSKKYDIPLYINKKSNGYYDDFLFAFNKSETDYVTLCHQDDIYMENFSLEVLKKIKQANDNLIIFSNYYDYKNETIIKKSKLLFVKRILNFLLGFKIFQNSKFIRRRILSLGNPICSPTVTFNKKLISEPVAKCPFRTSHDWYTWISLSNQKGKFVYIRKPLLLRRINELSETTLVIADNSKQKSDLEIFKMFWPESIAKLILKIYSSSEKNNIIDSNNMLIIDDLFPVKNSTFRYQEFKDLLNKIEFSNVLSTFESIRYANYFSKKEVIENLNKQDVNIVKKILTKVPSNINEYKLLYGLFLFNAYHYLLPLAEKYHIPFAFTLYPGGRFSLNDEKSDNMLKKVFSSKYFEKVIVTQKNTYDYLINNKFCPKNKIAFIFGGIMLEEVLKNNITVDKKDNIKNKQINICFVAYKYSDFGEDKGYDIFVDVAKKFINNNNIKFHVVGNFDKNTIDLEENCNIKFYGVKNPEWFSSFYKDMDIILSPNISGKIRKGSFDGFPTSSCLEAGLNGVAIFCTDPLNLNENRFINNKDIVIIKHDSEDICKKITYYYEHYDKLKELANNGRKKIADIYSYENQIIPRIKLLNNIIDNNNNSKVKSNHIFNLKINAKIKIRYYLNIIYGKFIRK